MATNLLQNGTFDADWGTEESHRCLVIAGDETSFENRDIGNIFTPPGWLTWFKHVPDTWDQPEVRDVHITHDPIRVLDGDQAIMMFSFFRHHDGGFLQQVNVAPGTRLRVCAHAHAWSNSKDGPHKDDARWSEGAGYAAGYRLEGNAPDDDWRNFTFYVGLDPTGGTNPYADTVVWGRGAHVYNQYAQLPGVEIEAQADHITVFLRSKVLWPFKHNDAYWDSATLTSVEVEPEPYESTMLILPQDGTPEQLAEVLEIGYPNRRTFGFSYDDGGHLNGTVILYNIPEEEQESFIDYYAARYPDVAVEFAYTSDWKPQSPWEEYLLWQNGPEWKNEPFGASTCDKTIGEAGCYITNVAVCQRVYDIDVAATPVTVDAALGTTGYNGCEARWDAIKEKCYIQISDTGDLNEHLSAGNVAMGEVRFPTTGAQHFVLLVEKCDGDYRILDPWYNEIALLSKRYTRLVSYRLLSKAVEPPPPPATNTRGCTGLHQQVIAPGAMDYHQMLLPGISKVFTLEDVIGMLRWSPDTLVVFRLFNNNSAPFLQNPDKLAGANAWLDQFRDSAYRICDQIAQEFPGKKPPYFVVESTNEDYPSLNAGVVSNVAAFDTAFIHAVADTGYPMAAGVFTAAVGNPHETEYELLLELGRTAMQYGAYFGYHNYWPGNPQDGGPDCLWEYLAGRWQGMDEYFTQRGVYVNWYGGESGVVGAEWGDTAILRTLFQHRDSYSLYGRARFREYAKYGISLTGGDTRAQSARGWIHFKPHDGWLSDVCYARNWPRYLQDILAMDQRLYTWNRTHQNRYKGIVLFTTGAGYTGWESFQIQHAEMADIRDSLSALYP